MKKTKRFFRCISSIFGRKNMFLENLAEKILSTAREIRKMLFFRQKSTVQGIFRKFGLQKSVLLAIEPCLMVGIVIIMLSITFLCEKNNEI